MNISNYQIEKHQSKTVIHYTRTLKDWIDILFYLLPGFAALAFVVLMVLYTDLQNWIYWVVAALFSFFALMKLAEGFSRLTQPTRSIIVIDHAEKKLVGKYPYRQKTLINLDDIVRIQLTGVNEKDTHPVRTYARIEVLNMYGELKTILLMNTKQLFRVSGQKIETELYDTGQKLAKFLAEQTNAKYQWMGFHYL